MPVKGSEPIPTFGLEEMVEPEPLQVNQRQMVGEFREGLSLFGGAYRELLSEEVFTALWQAGKLEPEIFRFPTEIWVKLVYELAAKYHQLWFHRMKLLTLMTPLYLGRVASFITRTRQMDSHEAEEVVEEQARSFEEHKSYLLELWKKETDSSRLEKTLGREV
jgi:hypothetical protein